MLVGYLPGFTRVEGEGKAKLPIRDAMFLDGASSMFIPVVQTLWHPTGDDLRVLLAGGGIQITLLGMDHPMTSVEIVERKTFDPIPDRSTPDEAEKAEGHTAATAEE